MENYYEILNLDFSATNEQIKTQYKKMAKIYHPDLHPELDSSIFLKIKQAAQTLLDEAKRKIYDKKLQSTVIEIIITQKESITGTKRTLNYTKFTICPKCKGKGCKYCNNKGQDFKNSKINITIPPKTPNGAIIRANNTILKIRIKDEKKLKIIDDIVYYDALITPYQAVLGGIIQIETLQGQSTIKIPPLTKTNQCFKLVEVGVVNKTTGKRGEQIVKIIIQVPENISKKEIELYKKLRNIAIKNENKN